MAAVAAGDAWRRIDYPDFVKRMPQLKGTMLGASGEKEFKDLRAMGASLVRYQMHANWSQFTNSSDAVSAYNAWMDRKLDHLHEMLPWARRYGIRVCVDLHTSPGGFTKEKYNSNMMFAEKKYEDLFVATWEKIAARFKGNQDVIYGYDLINEPIDRENKLTRTSWRAVMCRAIEAVRAIDPITPIVVEPNCNASPRGYDVKNIYGLKGFEPLPYDNLIYSVHVYQPMDFTHQGLFKKKADYNPVAYPNAEKGWNKDFLRKELESVRQFQLKTGARIYVGEFSAAVYAPGADKYIEDLCSLFLEFGWDWTYHAFREATCWSFEHEGASYHELKPAAGKTKRREILEKYMKWAPDAVFSPAFFWMWNGRLDADELCAQLEGMRAHGLRNVCIHPFPKGFREWFPTEMSPDYLTDGYLDVFAKVVRRAGELGMHAYLYDEGGWPSGGACGLVAASDPEGRFAPREMVCGGDGLEMRTRPYPKGVAAFPSLIERGTTQRFIDLTHEAYAKRLGADMGTTMRIAFTDEPNMPWGAAGPVLAWTADFADEFRRRMGYDILPSVPGLIADKARTNAALAQARIDLMDVKADLFVERYLAPLRDWCRAHGMMSGGHLNNEDDPECALDRGHGSLLRSLRAMDVPGVDVIWRQLFPSDGGAPAKVNPFPRYAASAAHQNGGRFALSESFGIFGDSVSPAQMKWTVDFQMARGVNLFVFAYLAQSNAKHWMTLFEPHFGPDAPHWDFAPHFFRYIERTSSFISQGSPGAEIVVLFNTRAFWAGRDDAEKAAKAHYAVASGLDEMNCDYEFAEDRDLACAEVLSGGRLRIGKMAYRAVVLPSEAWMLPAAKEALAKFEAAGGIVVRGLDLGRVPRTLRVSGGGARAIRVMKRVDGGRRIWFVMNEDMEDRAVELDFPERGAVVRYDPERDMFEFASADGKVRRTFHGGETAIYVTGAVPPAAAPMRFDGPVTPIDSGWTLRALVSHVAGAADFETRPCSGEAAPVALGDWRGVLGGTFSGKALYRVEFDSEAEGDALLDLGEVKWCASVRLNGVDLGSRFFGPFRWQVALKKGRNVLEVTVANLLVNQVGDDAIRDRILGEFRPNGKYDRFQRPFDRLNHESGLFGPVTRRMQ